MFLFCAVDSVWVVWHTSACVSFFKICVVRNLNFFRFRCVVDDPYFEIMRIWQKNQFLSVISIVVRKMKTIAYVWLSIETFDKFNSVMHSDQLEKIYFWIVSWCFFFSIRSQNTQFSKITTGHRLKDVIQRCVHWIAMMEVSILKYFLWLRLCCLKLLKFSWSARTRRENIAKYWFDT